MFGQYVKSNVRLVWSRVRFHTFSSDLFSILSFLLHWTLSLIARIPSGRAHGRDPTQLRRTSRAGLRHLGHLSIFFGHTLLSLSCILLLLTSSILTQEVSIPSNSPHTCSFWPQKIPNQSEDLLNKIASMLPPLSPPRLGKAARRTWRTVSPRRMSWMQTPKTVILIYGWLSPGKSIKSRFN